MITETIKTILTSKNLTVAVAESCTGGLVSSILTDLSGSSEYIKFNVVTYSNEAKEKFLKVPAEILAEKGAVSEETAKAMASGIRELSGCEIGLSTTGIAGPSGGTEEKPVGLMYCGVCFGKKYFVKKIQIDSLKSRKEIKKEFANEALEFLTLMLKAS